MLYLSLASMALVAAGGVWFAERRLKDRPWALGVLFGFLAVVANTCSFTSVAEYGIALSLRDAPVIAAALFFGPLPGVVAGAIAAVERALTPLWGAGAASWCPMATFLVALVAGAVRRWFFDGRRPCVVQALMLGVIFEAVHLSFDILMGIADLSRGCEIVFSAFWPESGAIALALALSCLCVREPGGIGSLWRSSASRLLFAFLFCGGLVIASLTVVAEFDSRRMAKGCVHRLDHLLDPRQASDFKRLYFPMFSGVMNFFESDYNVIASTNDWRIALANGGHERFVGSLVSAVGLRPGAAHARIDGEWCHVGEKRVGEWCVFCVVPIVESYGEAMVNSSVLTLVLFGLVFGFRIVNLRLRRQRQKIDRLREEVDRKRRQELELGAKIQRSCLPTDLPSEPGFAITARMRPAREVGGDFYDCYRFDDGRVVFAVADVSGKGVPAAMFMIQAKLILKSAMFRCPDPAVAVAETNGRLERRNEAQMFVTAWIGVFDPKTGVVEYVNAGHNPPLVKRADGSVEWLRTRGGMALGMFADCAYRVERTTLARGDRLFLYTDGVTEAQDPQGGFYGEGRLAKLLASTDGDPVASVFADVDAFADAAEQADDITVLALELKS